MSRIISLLNSGIISGPETVDSQDRMNAREAHADTLTVDESMFTNSRMVARIFRTILDTRNLREQAKSYDVVVLGGEDAHGLTALPGIGDEIASQVEVTDAQWEHLSTNPGSMEVFLNNMLVNPTKIDFTEEGREKITTALDGMSEDNAVISDHIESRRVELGEYDDECDYEDEWEDYDDEYDDDYQDSEDEDSEDDICDGCDEDVDDCICNEDQPTLW